MKQLCVLLVLTLSVLRIYAKLGPYYAHVCSGIPTKAHCPGDLLIAFSGIIYTQYQNNDLCGTVSADNKISLAQCSTLIATPTDHGTLSERFRDQCAGKKECDIKFSFDNPMSTFCNSTDMTNIVRVMYTCVLTTGQEETVVCSDPGTGKATTQFLSCPANMVIKITNIVAQRTEGGSVCESYIGHNEFEQTCAYTIGPSHDFYKLVVDTCSGWTSCMVKGTLIENPKSNAECATKAERNFQRIYYSCVKDTSTRVSLCSNDLNSTGPIRIHCEGSYVKITNIIADRIYNLNPSACPTDDSAKSLSMFGCAVQVYDLPFLDNISSNCNGRTSCDVSLSKYVSTPCGSDNARTRNWFVISYQCTKTPEADGYRVARVCNGSQLTLECSSGALLSFGSIYATVLFSTGNTESDYSCQTALSIGNSEVSACTVQLSSKGSGGAVYSRVTSCEGKNKCSVPISEAVVDKECVDYNPAHKKPRTYTHRQLYDVQYICLEKSVSDTSSSESTPVNSVGLGLGLAALFLVLIGAIVAVVIYRRRNRDGMTTKMSAPSTGNNYSNF